MADLTIVVQPRVAQVVTIAPRVAEVIQVNKQGPPGPQGASGATTFEWDQNTAATIWYVVHNLGRHPSVTIVDSTGREVYGDVNYIDANNITIGFNTAFGGKAYLN